MDTLTEKERLLRNIKKSAISPRRKINAQEWGEGPKESLGAPVRDGGVVCRNGGRRTLVALTDEDPRF